MTKLLTTEQVADTLGLSVSTVRKWVHEGFIPHIKVGRLVRFRTRDVEWWLEKRSVDGRVRRKWSVI